MNPTNKNLQLTGANYRGDRRELDFYPTPPEATIALMQFLQLKKCKIWEPACGNGAMSSVLEQYGHDVYSSDLNPECYGDGGVDFLKAVKTGFDAIITNPPFNISSKFIYKALMHCETVAMLLKSQYWHARGRQTLFNRHRPAWILPLTWRPDFLFQEREESGSPTMEMCWTVWLKGDTLTKYQPLMKPSIKSTNELF